VVQETSSKLSDQFQSRQRAVVNGRAVSGSVDQRYDISRNKEAQEIPRPANQAFPAVRPLERPTFSSLGGINRGFNAVNQRIDYNVPVDLTGGSNGFYGMSSGGVEQFGIVDTDAYVNPTKTVETIKALLEGAFDDDDDRPKTRSRKKRQEPESMGLIGKMKSLDMGIDGGSCESKDESDEEEDMDDDDGTIEGLNVKLLPHQVQGVQWMREKEKGKPKGGILADDVQSPPYSIYTPC
jgi:hypothetical protein